MIALTRLIFFLFFMWYKYSKLHKSVDDAGITASCRHSSRKSIWIEIICLLWNGLCSMLVNIFLSQQICFLFQFFVLSSGFYEYVCFFLSFWFFLYVRFIHANYYFVLRIFAMFFEVFIFVCINCWYRHNQCNLYCCLLLVKIFIYISL